MVHSTRQSLTPFIPDHEMLRIIGRGAYGEIWLGRGLTGALRAIKVIWRANFESERIFQREFSGMATFEPISRAHQGFVHILHVGREAENAFFYYIMELADDVENGRRIDPDNYHPRTLASDLISKGRLPAQECVRLGMSLSDTLAKLHAHGLSHRDIKPANIIFVDGEPKLADIGLVAVSGQRSFVGTEGYVPAEGPGSPQADLYSLGKVLYEISMGKDRLDFPELPADLDQWTDKTLLLQLNVILLRACANDPSKRHSKASLLGSELGALECRKPRKPLRWIILALGVLAAVGGLYWQQKLPPPKRMPGALAVVTQPAGAMVLLDEKVRTSPARFQDLEPGSHRLHIMREGYQPVDQQVYINPGRLISWPVIRLKRSRGALQVESLPGGATISMDGPLQAPPGEKSLHREGSTPFSMTDLPTGRYQITARLAASVIEQIVEVTSDEPKVAVLRFSNGSLKITSSPIGAAVLHDGVEIGRTPLLIEELPPGEIQYLLRLNGCRDTVVSGKIQAGAQTFLAAHLEKDRIVEPGKVFRNSMGRKLIPLGEVWIADTETSVAEYLTYSRQTGNAWKQPDFICPDNSPIMNVNWSDAVAFCRWLTQKERESGGIDAGMEYRLPTDAEWSEAVGLPNEGGELPEQRDGQTKDHYPWGKTWPPPAGSGNYGASGARDPDGFPQTSPCASFAPNHLGIYDLGGNVWEWCEDSYNRSERGWGVLRGGSWGNRTKPEMLSGYRNVIDRNERDVIYGFRYVLAMAQK